jgi:hypothetical protein
MRDDIASDYEIFGTRMLPSTVPLRAGTAPRPDARLPCYGLAQVDAGAERRLGIVSDVSPGGAFIWMDHGPEAGTRVQLALLQPGEGEAFRCNAVVVRTTDDGVGLSFPHPEPGLLGAVAGLQVV